MAETGGKSPLNNEIEALIVQGGAGSLISGREDIGHSPGEAAVQFEASQDFPLLSLTRRGDGNP